MIPWGASIQLQWRNGRTRQEHRLWLWVPLFAIWLVLLPMVLILFPLVALGCVFVRVDAVELYGTAWRILSSLRHTLVDVRNDAMRVRVSVA